MKRIQNVSFLTKTLLFYMTVAAISTVLVIGRPDLTEKSFWFFGIMASMWIATMCLKEGEPLNRVTAIGMGLIPIGFCIVYFIGSSWLSLSITLPLTLCTFSGTGCLLGIWSCVNYITFASQHWQRPFTE
jgi:hypothetical protein